jgi:hypothetical protein
MGAMTFKKNHGCHVASMYVGHCYEGDRARAQNRRDAGVEGDDEAPHLRPLRHAGCRGAAEDGPRHARRSMENLPVLFNSISFATTEIDR